MFIDDRYKWYFRIINIVLIIIVVFSLVKGCESTKTETPTVELPKPHPVEQVTIVDSLIGVKQEIRAVQDKKLLKTVDSLLTVLNRNANIDPQIVIKYQQAVEQNKVLGKYKDSLSNLIDKNISDQEKLAFYNKYKDNLVLTPAPYAVESKWLTQYGNILPGGVISIDSGKVLTEPYLSIGETGGGFFKKSKIAIAIGDHNPNVKISNLASYQYTPKPKRFGVTAGPGVFATPKGLTYGIGITAGYTISIK